MTQFHEGQEVQVLIKHSAKFDKQWRKAKITCEALSANKWHVEFTDGDHDFFDAEQIRPSLDFEESS